MVAMNPSERISLVFRIRRPEAVLLVEIDELDDTGVLENLLSKQQKNHIQMSLTCELLFLKAAGGSGRIVTHSRAGLLTMGSA